MSTQSKTKPRDLMAEMMAELERMAELQRRLVREAHAVLETA